MSFEPLYRLERSIPARDDKLLIIDRQGRVYLQRTENESFTIPDAVCFPELLSVELTVLGDFKNKTCFGCRWELDNLPCEDLRPAKCMQLSIFSFSNISSRAALSRISAL